MTSKFDHNIELLAKREFKEYITEKIDKLKYFYYDMAFFQKSLNLSYISYQISDEEKKLINELGKSFFKNKEVIFNIDSSKVINNFCISKYYLLMDNSKISQLKQSFIEEFVLYILILRLDISKKRKDYIIKSQKNNFNYIYLHHIIKLGPASLYKEDWFKFKPGKSINSIALTINQYNQYINQKLDTVMGESIIEEDLYNYGSTYDYLISNVTNEELKWFSKEIHEIKNLEQCIEDISLLYINPKWESIIDFVFYNPIQSSKEILASILEKCDPIKNNKNSIPFYRGQANSHWNVTPSITRDINHLNNEKEMFYDILSLLPNEFSEKEETYNKLIKMQHYGLPTRLLDISRNPLIALYFACDLINIDGSIYYFECEKNNILNFNDQKLKCLNNIVISDDSNICENCTELVCPFGNITSSNNMQFMKKSFFVQGVANNKRIGNQSGDFIFVGLDQNGTKCKEEIDQSPTKVIVISSKIKKQILEDLSLINIHIGTVYPDLSNMNKFIRSKYSSD